MMTDAELTAELDARFVRIEDRLTTDAAPELPSLDALREAYENDADLIRAQDQRRARIDAGTWTGA
jgi:hypothetical protein